MSGSCFCERFPVRAALLFQVLEKSCEDNVERAYCHFWAGKAFFEGKKAEQA